MWLISASLKQALCSLTLDSNVESYMGSQSKMKYPNCQLETCLLKCMIYLFIFYKREARIKWISTEERLKVSIILFRNLEYKMRSILPLWFHSRLYILTKILLQTPPHIVLGCVLWIFAVQVLVTSVMAPLSSFSPAAQDGFYAKMENTPLPLCLPLSHTHGPH